MQYVRNPRIYSSSSRVPSGNTGEPLLREGFVKDGFVLFPQLLDRDLVVRLQHVADELLSAISDEHREEFRYQGTMLPVPHWRDALVDLIGGSAIRHVAATLRFADLRWVSGYLISKPPKSPSLWWHQDWWAWEEPVSASPVAPYVFVAVYLCDTTFRNGCLRVIPGSHRKRHKLHALPPAHSSSIKDCARAHTSDPSERSVAAYAGDIVVADARLLHATHANTSDSARTCLILWYAPDYNALPRVLRNKMAVQHSAHAGLNGAHELDLRLSELRPSDVDPRQTVLPYDPVPGRYLS